MVSVEAELKTPIYADLAGKVAVVTGGTKGIGAATCRALLENRVRLAVVARSQDGIDELMGEMADGQEIIGIRADCTKWPEVEAARKQVEDRFGGTDILLPFAGGFEGYTPIEDISEREWHSVVDWNLTSTFLTVKAFLPGMIKRRSGTIVTMSSCSGRYLDSLVTASYAAAKAGIAMFTRHVAIEVGKYGIRVNCVAPATTLSERVERIMTNEKQERLAAMSPLGRLGRPEDTAMATLFLISDAAAWITGVTIDVAGGRIML